MISATLSKVKRFFSKKFVKSALFLFVCVFLCKVLGLIYRIPLTNIVGLEGVGLYQLVFPLYSFLLILSSNAVPLALSKMISRKLKEGEYIYVSKLKKIAFIFFAVLGTFFSMLLLVFARHISFLQGNEGATLGYYFIAPSILLVAIIAVFRGIFQAEKNMVPTGISQIIEQVLKFGFGIFLPLLFAHFGTLFQVALCLMAVTISEFCALVFLLVAYVVKKRKSSHKVSGDNAIQISNNVKNIIIFKDLIKNIIPILISNLIVPFCVLIESFLIVNILTYLGVEMWQATAVYGAYSGIVCTLINAPTTLISSIGLVLVPYVSENKEAQVQKRDELNTSFKLTTLISVPFLLCYCFFSYFIVYMLFPSLSVDMIESTAIMLSISSINVVSLSFTYVISNYLQSIDLMYEPVKCFLFFNIFRLIIGFLALMKFGIIAFVAVSAFVYLCQFFQIFSILRRIKC